MGKNKKKKKRNPVLDYMAYIGLRVIVVLFHLFPIERNLRTGRWLGRVMWHVIGRDIPFVSKILRRKRREPIMSNLKLALGDEYSERQLEQIGARSCEHLAMFAIECLLTNRYITLSRWKKYVTLKNFESALRVLLEHHGAIVLTGHYGSWEVLGYTLATLGFDMSAVMRPLDNPYMNDYLVQIRARHGLNLLYKKGASAAMGKIIEEGQLLGFIADQDAGRKGLFVDFFGEQASTYKSIGLVAMETNRPIIVGCARRTSWKEFHYELEVEDIIYPCDWQGREDELRYITQRYTSAIEQMVRKDPSQYLWLHRRWKTRPRVRNKSAN